MLPGLGFSEVIVLAVIALLVIGPKDLPNFLRALGRWTRKMQALAAEFRQGFDELARQAELDELRKEVDALRRGGVPLDDVREQAAEIHREVTSPVDPAPAPPAALEQPAQAAHEPASDPAEARG